MASRRRKVEERDEIHFAVAKSDLDDTKES
jgi:hypothetical protein